MSSSIKVGVDELRNQEKLLTSKLEKIKDGIAALQEICTHNMQPDGHDSHHRYFKCEWCGKQESD